MSKVIETVLKIRLTESSVNWSWVNESQVPTHDPHDPSRFFDQFDP